MKDNNLAESSSIDYEKKSKQELIDIIQNLEAELFQAEVTDDMGAAMWRVEMAVLDRKEVCKELVGFWYDLIVLNHHKDKDCHFYVTEDFRYGGEVEITVKHHGYIVDGWSFTAPDFNQAYRMLEAQLRRQILEEINSVETEFLQGKREEYNKKFSND